ncbi:ARM repeat-containing protein [Coemansia reversa NRRL 1564]|uniref:AP-1 complex subunit gamma n=1 Tax=Coemansia reversa (strain ATCC 12441 / NRRL 1564) TaxID=763665 RepID=A0A2G5B4H0_COERN|nr:ARM repeat-containing protein [Coemansia reversa NRRL 1564]|eukprot:PIA13896.1 ARM repeat-containing protein [Coemansia reversa NRRL 1564]
MSFFRLKDLIRAVRVCKTAADERNVIRRESAAIRTSFRSVESQDARYVNVQKLVYIFLLGFPVQFGQLECVKLAASPRFSDKRVGYLGVGLLLEEQELVTLVTNSLKTDLNSADDYIVGLALGALAGVASPDVARDLADEVVRLLDAPRAYIRKKAALAAVRLVRQTAELADSFARHVRVLLRDRHHGVQLAAAALAVEVVQRSADAQAETGALATEVLRQLRGLATDASPEHSVGGINDPFLQVTLLRVLRVAAQTPEAADAANDVLTQVATQVDGSRNVGTAVLYECAVTALAIPSAASLRLLAINLLGRLLADADGNARSVALAALAAAVVSEASAVQRHRATVMRCLRDADATIRRRAVDLAFALVNADNATSVVDELLRALPHADAELRPSIVRRLAAAVTLFAPSLPWYAERMLRVLASAGGHMNDRDLFRFPRRMASDADASLQRRAARASFALLARDRSQTALVFVAAWMIGEYGDLLVAATGEPSVPEPADAAAALGDEALVLSDNLPAPTPAAVVRLLADVAAATDVPSSARSMALTALTKLAGRFAAHPTVVTAINYALSKHTRASDAEEQARAVEYSRLMRSDLDAVRPAVVERMPAPEYKEIPYDEYVLNPTAMRMKALVLATRPAAHSADLIGEEAQPAAAASSQTVVSDLLSLMDETPSAPAPASPQPANSSDAIADLLSTTSLSPPLSAVPTTLEPVSPVGLDREYDVLRKHGFYLTLKPSKRPDQPDVIDLLATFRNNGESAISDLSFLVAVPRSQKIHIHPPSGQHISVGSEVTQRLRVSNPSHAAIRLRMKISYNSDGQHHEEMLDYSGFPSSIV